MKNITKFRFALAGVATLLATGIVKADAATVRVTGAASPPIGHVQFCAVSPDDCGGYDRPSQVVRLSAEIWESLNSFNTTINQQVAPATDMEIYGTLERWTYPGAAGDCEDYVLAKRRALVAAGWPASALLITVVRDEIGDGHAVLTVRTDRGDLILDNKTDEILVWDMTPYRFLKRQSARHAAAWDTLDDGRGGAVASVGAN